MQSERPFLEALNHMVRGASMPGPRSRYLGECPYSYIAGNSGILVGSMEAKGGNYSWPCVHWSVHGLGNSGRCTPTPYVPNALLDTFLILVRCTVYLAYTNVFFIEPCFSLSDWSYSGFILHISNRADYKWRIENGQRSK